MVDSDIEEYNLDFYFLTSQEEVGDIALELTNIMNDIE